MAGGFFGGVFGGPTTVDTGNLSSLYSQREGQISDFANQLATARQTYMNQITNNAQQVYSMFGKNLAASMGASGMTPSSGAFASGAGREATQLYSGLATAGFNATNQGLSEVNNAQAGAYAPYMQGLSQANGLNASMANAYQQNMLGGIGQLAGTGAGIGMMSVMGPGGAAAAPMAAGSGVSLPFSQPNYLTGALAAARSKGLS